MVNLGVDVLVEDADEPPSSMIEEELPSTGKQYLEQYLAEPQAVDAYERSPITAVEIIDGLLSYEIPVPASSTDQEGQYQTSYWANEELDDKFDSSSVSYGTVAEEAEADYETHLIKYLLDDTPTINNDPLSARREDEQEARILKTFFDTLYRREVEAGAREYAALVQRYASWN
ncbi:MAG: hypothetical protein QT02_C0010G0014 [archaeon GW2011_AR9]|nr:MAG: hypothetical protein QT02_C0010G0014 [archaeon GW2011_AR9]MBS3120149.1 hypothetical protein [Candidatus Woesearchaeota archaeon]HIH12228.1 hypothetical protein [Candidatus Woesearchaeota archaeon]